MSSGNPWTPEQVALIRRLAGKTTPQAIAERVSAIGPAHSLASLYRWASDQRMSLRPGRKAARLPDRRRSRWSAPEDAALRDRAGRMSPAEIAAALNRLFYTDRTDRSIEKRAEALGVSLRRGVGLDMGQMLRTFPASGATIGRMVEDGHLRAGRVGGVARGSGWLFLPADIEAWLRARPYQFDWRRVAAGPWRDLVRGLSLRDPHLTVQEAARRIGVPRSRVWAWIRGGLVPEVVLLHKSRHAGYRIPLSALDRIERLARKGAAA